MDLRALKPADLAPVDEFHVRGRKATEELARLSKVQPGETVLDVGCGLADLRAIWPPRSAARSPVSTSRTTTAGPGTC